MILHSEGFSNLKQFPMTTASILQTKHHSSVLISALSSSALCEHRPETTGRSAAFRQPVQIKWPLSKADLNRWKTQFRQILHANRGMVGDLSPKTIGSRPPTAKQTPRKNQQQNLTSHGLRMEDTSATIDQTLTAGRRQKQWLKNIEKQYC